MASETDFLNMALGKAGCARISGIDDGTPNAGWCKTYYEGRRRSLLALANWKFADTQLQLNLDAEVPLFGFAYAYALPPDIVKFRTYNGIQVNVNVAVDWERWIYFGGNWRIQGRNLISNEASAYIEYVRDVTDPTLWTPLFSSTLEHMLASDLAVAIRHDHSAGKELLEQAMGFWLPEALAVDAQAQAIQQMPVDDFIWGRNNP